MKSSGLWCSSVAASIIQTNTSKIPHFGLPRRLRPPPLGVWYFLKSIGIDVTCRACQRAFVVCRRCWRGQTYCSESCQKTGYGLRRREASQRYQDSGTGKRNHARRQQLYRRRSLSPIEPAINKVTHEGTRPDAVPVVIATKAVADKAEASKLLLLTGPMLRHARQPMCAFCAASVDFLPRVTGRRSIRNIEARKRRRHDIS